MQFFVCYKGKNSEKDNNAMKNQKRWALLCVAGAGLSGGTCLESPLLNAVLGEKKYEAKLWSIY